MIWEANPRYALAAVGLTLLGSLVAPTQIWISKILIDGIIDSIEGVQDGTPIDWTALLSPIVAILLVWSVGAVSQSLTVHMRMLLGVVRISVKVATCFGFKVATRRSAATLVVV